jgi:hypothetical protein
MSTIKQKNKKNPSSNSSSSPKSNPHLNSGLSYTITLFLALRVAWPHLQIQEHKEFLKKKKT